MSIQTNMKTYPYNNLSNTVDEYGQMGYGATGESTIETYNYITMAIYLSNQATNQNINYVEADYIGLTEEEIDDKFVIDYDGIKLKVKYVNSMGRYKIVALVKI